MKASLYRIWQKHGRLSLILLVYTLATLVYSSLLPPFEYADGPRHLAYSRWLITQKQFPPQGDAAWETPVKQEAGQPPLYHLLVAIPVYALEKVAPGDLDQWPLIFRPNPTYNGSHTRHYADNDNIALHLPEDSNPLQGEWLALVLARGITLLFGLGLLIGIYHLTRELFPQRPFLPEQITLFTAFIPQVLYMSGVVSNDIPVAALCTLSFLFLWRMLRKPGFKYGLAVGLAIGLAALTKVSAITLIPVAGVGFFWLWQRKDNQRDVWLTIATALGSLLLVAGWWFGRAWLLYGTPFGLTAHDQAPWAFNEVFQRDSIGQQWLDVFESFWVSIGWSPTQFHDGVYWLLLGLVALAVIGLIKRLWQAWQSPQLSVTLRQNPKPVFMFMMLLMLGLTGLALEAWMHRVSAPFGRLLFPALAPITILLILGWRAIHRQLINLMLLIIGILAILTPIVIIRPTYHPQLVPASTFDQTDKTGRQYGAIAELIRVALPQREVEADSILPVEVCWHTLARAESEYLVLVQLIGPDNRVIANRVTTPGLGSYPTIAWSPDTYFCDQIEVRLWRDISPTLVYKIEVGLLEAGGDARLPITDASGNPVATAFVGEVKVNALDEPDGTLPPRHSTTPDIDLLQANTSTNWSINAAQAIDLEWGVYDHVPVDYQVFMHLIDPQNGQLVAQSDGAPFAGWYGTSWWPPKTIVAETRDFFVPAATPTGTYQLVIGLYDLNTGERLVETMVEEITLQP